MTRSVSPKPRADLDCEPHPERLLEGQHGRLLQDANREFVGELDEAAAFRRVSARLSAARTARPWRNFWLLPAALVVLAVFAALPAAMRRLRSADPPLVAAEDWRGFPARRSPVISSATPASTETRAGAPRAEGRSPSESQQSAQAASSSSVRSEGRAERRSAPASAAESLAAPPAPAPVRGVDGGPPAAPAAAPSDVGVAPDCLSLARRGQTRDAEACFLKRAEGSGLGAEMALYEVARLRRDVLADPTGALAALAEYRTRFPAGALRREADMSQLELLLQLGRSDEALKQSDQLLSSSASGERAAELHLLRGHILRKAQSRFAEAAHEYELAESAGLRGGEVTYFRALCLEALAQTPQAAALFAKYLEQPQPAYAEDARRHLKRLTP